MSSQQSLNWGAIAQGNPFLALPGRVLEGYGTGRPTPDVGPGVTTGVSSILRRPNPPYSRRRLVRPQTLTVRQKGGRARLMPIPEITVTAPPEDLVPRRARGGASGTSPAIGRLDWGGMSLAPVLARPLPSTSSIATQTNPIAASVSTQTVNDASLFGQYPPSMTDMGTQTSLRGVGVGTQTVNDASLFGQYPTSMMDMGTQTSLRGVGVGTQTSLPGTPTASLPALDLPGGNWFGWDVTGGQDPSAEPTDPGARALWLASQRPATTPSSERSGPRNLSVGSQQSVDIPPQAVPQAIPQAAPRRPAVRRARRTDRPRTDPGRSVVLVRPKVCGENVTPLGPGSVVEILPPQTRGNSNVMEIRAVNPGEPVMRIASNTVIEV